MHVIHTHKKRDSTHAEKGRSTQACKGIHYYNTCIHTSREIHKERSTEAQQVQAQRGTVHRDTERGTHRERHNTHTHNSKTHTERSTTHTTAQQQETHTEKETMHTHNTKTHTCIHTTKDTQKERDSTKR